MTTPPKQNHSILAPFMRRRPEEIRPSKACEKAVETYGFSSVPEIAQIPITDRLKAIVPIRDYVLQRQKAKRLPRGVRIDETEIPDEVNALKNLTSSMRFSSCYHDMIMTIATEALETLTRDVSILREYAALPHRQKKNFLKTVPIIIKNQARQHLADHLDLARHLQNNKINFHSTPQRVNPETGESLVELASARISMRYWPGCTGLFMNTHPDALFGDIASDLGKVFHECVHSFEGQFSYMLHYSPEIVPEWLRKDAALICLNESFKTDIPSELYSGYRNQFNEVTAHEVGNFAEERIRKRLVPSSATSRQILIKNAVTGYVTGFTPPKNQR